MTKWIYDWPQIIRDLQADAYTEAGKLEVSRAADSWDTCPCSNLDYRIPFHLNGRPYDEELFTEACNFETAIDHLCRANTARTRDICASHSSDVLTCVKQREAELVSNYLVSVRGLKENQP